MLIECIIVYFIHIILEYIKLLIPLQRNLIIKVNMRIKEVIKEKKLTVKAVAKKLGMSSPSLSNAINGNPTVEKLEKIASVLGVPISELFEKSSENVVKCPNCGTRLVLRKEL